MVKSNINIKDEILLKALDNVAFDGWSWDIILQASIDAGYDQDMAIAVFPNKVMDAVLHFSDRTDREMLMRLQGLDPDSMRIRDRIRLAVQTRISVLKDHKEAVRHSTSYWLRPMRKYKAAHMIWKTADIIWDWAGDTATDYNRYTKRALLSGVLSSAIMAWLDDDTQDASKTLRFLDNRIDNVMQISGFIGKLKSGFGGAGFFKRTAAGRSNTTQSAS